MSADLFSGEDPIQTGRETLAPGAVILRGRAIATEAQLLEDIARISAAAPFRNMTTPGGYKMSVAMTNCGGAGWVTDAQGYRYARNDPLGGAPWPAMPASFLTLAKAAAAEAGFPGFAPDGCLINRYEPGAKLSLHQDKDEQDLGHPIVSVSLGLPAVFQFGGLTRAAPVHRYPLLHGDVVVWGGPMRLAYHGILALKPGEHPRVGQIRLNLTFRHAL
ncbi:DNA oxidative demethylase AlkB [Paracoccus aminophilus]|uniref:Alkylated DNA repair protein AlkB n=1 Tax=Paracoccus aminophilus JCM 7686 TaxID=1367847 RepID=S5Z138_PARAH|nr:DNA oxidative demethylase AlkB [Paracoccus aminophilus]AGT11141.1 alkylated DNA repair protein AlkB [Paracoccus aminophilus JCM 7686]